MDYLFQYHLPMDFLLRRLIPSNGSLLGLFDAAFPSPVAYFVCPKGIESQAQVASFRFSQGAQLLRMAHALSHQLAHTFRSALACQLECRVARWRRQTLVDDDHVCRGSHRERRNSLFLEAPAKASWFYAVLSAVLHVVSHAYSVMIGRSSACPSYNADR